MYLFFQLNFLLIVISLIPQLLAFHKYAGLPKEFMGPRANSHKWDPCMYLVCRLYLVNFVNMWGWGACPENILRFRPSEIEFESNFSSISQYLLSTEYIVPFWILKILRIKSPQDLMWAGIYYNNLKLIAYTFLIAENWTLWDWCGVISAACHYLLYTVPFWLLGNFEN